MNRASKFGAEHSQIKGGGSRSNRQADVRDTLRSRRNVGQSVRELQRNQRIGIVEQLRREAGGPHDAGDRRTDGGQKPQPLSYPCVGRINHGGRAELDRDPKLPGRPGMPQAHATILFRGAR